MSDSIRHPRLVEFHSRGFRRYKQGLVFVIERSRLWASSFEYLFHCYAIAEIPTSIHRAGAEAVESLGGYGRFRTGYD